MSTTTKGNPMECAAVDPDHMRAAGRLILEVYKVVEGKKSLNAVFARWKKLMAAFRGWESRCFVRREASAEDLEQHKNIVIIMIMCAKCIVVAASTRLKIDYRLEESEKAALREASDLVDRHGKILDLEFNGWHGPLSREQMQELGERIFSDGGRIAA